MGSRLLTIVAILIAGEIIFVTIAATIIYFIRHRNTLQNHATTAATQPPVTSAVSLPASITQYWKEEIERTQDTILARNKYSTGDHNNINLLALNLRLQILQLEQQTSLTDADKRIIEDIESNIINILNRMGIIDALNFLVNKPDDIDSQKLIEEQRKTISILKKYTREILDKILRQNADFLGSQQGHEDLIALTNAHNDFLSESNSLIKKIELLESQNTELYQCVAILEDENKFLRDQIASLLSLPDKK